MTREMNQGHKRDLLSLTGYHGYKNKRFCLKLDQGSKASVVHFYLFYPDFFVSVPSPSSLYWREPHLITGPEFPKM